MTAQAMAPARSKPGTGKGHSAGTATGGRVVVCSIMRNAEPYLEEYLAGINRLGDVVHRVVIVEGDSTDATRLRLQAAAAKDPRLDIIHHDTGSRVRGSVVRSDRLAAMSTCMNLALDRALEHGPDRVLYLTADLRWPADLVGLLGEPGAPIVAPLVLREDGRRFWDVWGFRKGRSLLRRGPGNALGCFRPHAPYHTCVRFDRPFEVDSAGSVMLLDPTVLRAGARFTAEEDVVGFCREARARGFAITVQPKAVCIHPERSR